MYLYMDCCLSCMEKITIITILNSNSNFNYVFSRNHLVAADTPRFPLSTWAAARPVWRRSPYPPLPCQPTPPRPSSVSSPRRSYTSVHSMEGTAPWRTSPLTWQVRRTSFQTMETSPRLVFL